MSVKLSLITEMCIRDSYYSSGAIVQFLTVGQHTFRLQHLVCRVHRPRRVYERPVHHVVDVSDLGGAEHAYVQPVLGVGHLRQVLELPTDSFCVFHVGEHCAKNLLRVVKKMWTLYFLEN